MKMTRRHGSKATVGKYYDGCHILQTRFLSRNYTAESIEAMKELDDILAQLAVSFLPFCVCVCLSVKTQELFYLSPELCSSRHHGWVT